MLYTLQEQLALPGSTLMLAGAVALLAGAVRGFAGFGLSAIIMAALAVQISPVALIPVCFVLEAFASVFMFRGGMSEGNKPLVLKLTAGYALGMPLGLSATHAASTELSSTIALTLIMALVVIHLLQGSRHFAHARWHPPVAGLIAGVGTGLASVGGLVIALYMLLSQMDARQMRGSLILFLFLNMLITAFWLIVSGTLNILALKRALTLAPLLIIGVLIGTALFRPSLEPYYKRVCLVLLLGLASVGLVRKLIA